MRRRNAVLIMILSLLMIAPAVSAQTDSEGSAQYPDPARFEEAIRAFEAGDVKNMPPRGAIVGAGSSSMRGWHNTIHDDLDPLTIIPRGFGGSNMNDLVYFADRVVLKYMPRAVMIYEGDNDTASGIPPAVIRDTFLEFVSIVHKELPETRIYFLTIKPSVARWEMWPRMKEANALIAAECEKNGRLTYLDVSTPMLDGTGAVRKDIFVEDNLHMNRAGYEIWTETVWPVLIKKELKFERNVR